jgi:hypothetical protein
MKTMKLGSIRVSCALLALGVSPLWAAERAAAGAAMPQPNLALQQLQPFAGSWRCTGMDFGGPDGSRDHATTAKVTAV